MNDYIEEQLRRVSIMIEREEFADAIDELRQLEPYLADDGRAWQLRGFAHFGVGEFEKATAALETAALLVPLGAAAQLRLAQLYLRSRRREAAKTIYLHLADLHRTTRRAAAEEEVERIAVGLAEVEAYDEALRYCLKQRELFAGSHKLPYVAACAMRGLGRPDDEILTLLREAHRLEPTNVSYRIALARCLVAVGRSEEARGILNGVDLDATECIPSLEWMRMLFERLNVAEGVEHCRARLQAIAFEVNSGYRPRNSWFTNDE